MFGIRSAMRILGAAAGIALVLPAHAQLVDSLCHGDVKVVSQQQTGNQVNLQVEVAIEDCTGVCIGSLEYKLLFTDAANNEIQWHMTEHWNWREADGAFTVAISEDILPGATLKEVQEMRIGRCSCSTRVER
jgi:hypothetical protein